MNDEHNILDNLIKSCVDNDPISFIPFLLDKNVKVLFPNKVKFYCYLKILVNYAQEKVNGKLCAVIEKPYEYNIKGGQNLCFYDERHKFPLIVLEFIEENGKLCLDAHPF